MRIIAVDDETLALDNLLALVRKTVPGAEALGFTKPREALAHITLRGADVALLDVEMPGLHGMELARLCKEACPSLNVIFVTGYSQYALEAHKLRVSGYLLKPARESDLRAELANLRTPPPALPGHGLWVQTFGSFEVFSEGTPLPFPRSKSKECFAYLVDRKGSAVTTAELAALLWGDRPMNPTVQNNVHKAISDMMKALRSAGAEDVVYRRRNQISIRPDKVDCDYFRALAGDAAQINAFRGEYMVNYGWAEFTLGALNFQNRS